jgi:hypothetical protein
MGGSTFGARRQSLQALRGRCSSIAATPVVENVQHADHWAVVCGWCCVAQGYGPISIRLVEAALKGGWGPVAEVLSMMPGGQFDSLQVRQGT